jgi:tripartite ATP-independent transporter DctM subunit
VSVYLISLIIVFLLLLRVPVFLAIGSGCALYFITNDFRIATLATRATFAIDTLPLVAIPLFILAGRIMNISGVTERIFRLCNAAVGFVPGGLGHVNVAGSLVFAGMSGSALADLGALGRVQIEMMRNAGYPLRFAVGLTLAASIMGPIIPPSVAAIIYAINADVSIIALFLASIVPGLVIAAFLMIAVFLLALYRKYPRQALPDPRKLLIYFISALPCVLAPFLLIGGMATGIFGPTEAASVAVLYSLLLGLVIYRELKPVQLIPTFIMVGKEIASLMLIVAMGVVYGWILTIERVPQDVANYVLQFSDVPYLALSLVLGIAFALGLVLDVVLLLLILPPIIVPPLVQMGFDPLHIGVLLIIVISIGIYTPPFGVALFLVQQITGESYAEVVRAVLPWLIPLIMAVAVLALAPDLALTLPRALGF